MAFFEKDNEQEGEEQEELEMEKVKIGDEEYTQDELANLVGLGKIAKEAEEKFSTKIDKVYPEFTKKSQLVKDYEAKIKDLETQASQAQQKVRLDPTDEVAVKEAKEAARNLGILLKDDLAEMGIVTKSDFRNYYNEVREAEKLLDNMRTLETKYDGKDGRPRFDTESLLEYMTETGIQNPEVAYKIKHEEDLSTWKEQQIAKARKPGYDTIESGSGAKQPGTVKVTRDNIDKLVGEALEGKF